MIDSNILLFDVLFRYKSNITSESMDIFIEGKPFNGIFNSNISVSVPYVGNLENETDSTYRVEIIKEENLVSLERDVNTRLKNWINLIIRSDINVNKLIKYFEQIRSDLVNENDQIGE